MKLFYFVNGPLRVNTYFVVNEKTNQAIVIDSGENYKKVIETAQNLGVKIEYLLLTHAHFDHAFNAKAIQDNGVKVVIGKKELPLVYGKDNLASNFGRTFIPFTPDIEVVDGDVLDLIGFSVRVIETPGHTIGSVTYIVEDAMFTGDTLFNETVGRTDFPTGNKVELIKSVKKLFAIDGDYKVYPGHDQFTTLDYERKHNLFADYS